VFDSAAQDRGTYYEYNLQVVQENAVKCSLKRGTNRFIATDTLKMTLFGIILEVQKY